MERSVVLRHCLMLMMALTCSYFAHAAPYTWTGAVDEDWGHAANWSPPGPPGLGNLAVIPEVPAGGRFPTIQPGEAFCSGMVLAEDAEVVLTSGAALYIVGSGDLDGDGLADVDEVLPGAMDVDLDGDPNLDDTDSDGDGMDDGWEDLHGFRPYSVGNPGDADHPLSDPDGDGRDNLTEYDDGTDPWIPDMPMPAGTGWALLLASGLVLGVTWTRSRPNGRWARAMLSILLIVGLMMVVVTDRAVFASRRVSPDESKASVAVDFAIGQHIPAAAKTADSGDTLLLLGSSARPWNGRSTYVTKPLTLKAANGPVFLGGMRTQVAVAVSGEGAVNATSSYISALHPMPVAAYMDYGTHLIRCFLGERLSLAPTPAAGWGFFAWSGDASGSGAPLAFQSVEDGLGVTAVFAPPGGDLHTAWSSQPFDSRQSGDALSATFTVTNIGQAATSGTSWWDGLYLSRDTGWDDTDLEIDLQAHSGPLPSAGSYNVVVSEVFPDLAPGVYYVLGVADVSGAAEASTEDNTVSKRVAVLDTVLAR